MQIMVKTEVCTGCETCLSSCPYDAIVMKDDRAFINEYCQLCKACLGVCPDGAISEFYGHGEVKAAGADSSYKGVLIFAEQRCGALARVSMELLGVGRELASQLSVELSAVLLGADVAAAEELIKWGADRVYHCPDRDLDNFNDLPYADVLYDVINRYKPEIVLAGATPIGRSFLPRVAVRLKAGLTADCTTLKIEDGSRNLVAIRPAFGGNIMASILCPNNRPQLATVRPMVMKPGAYDSNRKGEIIGVARSSSNGRGTRVIGTEKEKECGINIAEAEIIVSGGRGVGGAKGFELLTELAGLLGGSVGASRAAVDEGWIPYSHQVGQTGRTVCPKIYISCGISGAVQHIVGMQSSDVIIAINKNGDAPIFNTANYGVVGDLHELLPLLIKNIKDSIS